MLYCDRCDRTYADRSVCPTCGLALVERDDAEELVAILRTSDATLLPLIQSVLDAAGIPFVIQGGEALGLLPLGPFGGGMFRDALGAAVLVPRERADEARALLEGCNVEEAPE